MAVEIDKSLYYNPNALLSFNRVMNFVIGQRGLGKSYAWKVHPIKRFIKHKEQFIYVRRYKTELKNFDKYFDDVRQEFPDHKLEVKGKCLYVDGELMGWAIPLSAWQSMKSTAFPYVCNIVFDEFIREKDIVGYLPNEVEAFLNLCHTVFRSRDNVRAICLSNSVTIVNPYFLYFNLVPDINKRFNKFDDCVVEIPPSYDFAEQQRQTKFGKLVDGTNYGDMALDNVFVGDSDTFLEKRSKESRYGFTLVYNGINFGVWYDNHLNLMYVSGTHDPNSSNRFALTLDDVDEKTSIVRSKNDNYYIGKFVKAFRHGVLRFENQTMRNLGYEMLNKLKA